MFPLNPIEIWSFRALCMVPLLLGLGFMLTGSDTVSLQKFIAAGSHQLSVDLNNRIPVSVEIRQSGVAAPDHVIINEATFEDLRGLPGIGSKTASLIIEERKAGKFFDWRDFDDRVKSIGPAKIKNLKEAGVKLNSND
ncbi:MAG TPA: helix-hairpin-helix domain-containing protein [Candidatus Rifleibacterium sp.]|nr:helix-hairpin-helix domain-containing protein [Candidatus Rifleibacterium sp.]HPT47955.1 helix-hairpin-helix domain-containing protein [Candidatus Rifleibacterium sp.]